MSDTDFEVVFDLTHVHEIMIDSNLTHLLLRFLFLRNLYLFLYLLLYLFLYLLLYLNLFGVLIPFTLRYYLNHNYS
jgi:hypothetical protein